jgi:hypothetical protein
MPVQVEQCETYEQVMDRARRTEARRRQELAKAYPVQIFRPPPEKPRVVVEAPIHPSRRNWYAKQIGPIYIRPDTPEWDAYQCTWSQEETQPRKRPSVKDLLIYVSAKRDVDILDMMSARRTAHVARARQIVMYLAKRFTLLSLPAIGRHLAGKDHTTILHGVRKIELLRADPKFDAEIRGYLKELGEPE